MRTPSVKRPSQALAKRQSGVVLVVCLVLLLVVTALGLSSMDSTSLEMKMASGFRDRSVAFEVTEEALSVAEAWLSETNLNDSDFYSTCTGSNCFDDTCANGLCAFYKASDPYTGGIAKLDCGTLSLEPPDTPVWRWAGGTDEPNLWLSSTKSVAVDPSHPDVETDARYIIEFMCYADKNSTDTCETSADNCMPQFRVTAMARGLTDSSVVMLQTMFKKVN